MTVSEELSKLEELFEGHDYEIVEIQLGKTRSEQLKKEVEELTAKPIETSITSLNGIKIVVVDDELLKDKMYLVAVKPKEKNEENE